MKRYTQGVSHMSISVYSNVPRYIPLRWENIGIALNNGWTVRCRTERFNEQSSSKMVGKTSNPVLSSSQPSKMRFNQKLFLSELCKTLYNRNLQLQSRDGQNIAYITTLKVVIYYHRGVKRLVTGCNKLNVVVVLQIGRQSSHAQTVLTNKLRPIIRIR